MNKATYTALLLAASALLAACAGAPTPAAPTPTAALSPTARPSATSRPPTSIPTPTAQPPLPRTALTPIPSPFQRRVDLGSRQVVYIHAVSESIGYFIEDPNSSKPDTPWWQHMLSIYQKGEGPGAASMLAFANYTDYITYLEPGPPLRLWVSDLAYQNPRLIFEQSAQEGLEVRQSSRLLWSPDDTHLTVQTYEDPALDLIYHFQSDIVEPWGYVCDRAAPSPRTGMLALWCPSRTGGERFAVMEWGGEIWYSAAPPQGVLVRWEGQSAEWLGAYAAMAWSPDGERLAYFDPDDPQGHLRIADAQGVIHKLLPGGAYWLTGAPWATHLQDGPIEWSADGRRLLVLARGAQEHPCPATTSEMEIEPQTYYNDACWHVIDAASGRVLWNLSDSYEQLGVPDAASYYQAALSADGRFLMGSAIKPGWRLSYLLEVDTHEIQARFPSVYDDMRWGAAPVWE